MFVQRPFFVNDYILYNMVLSRVKETTFDPEISLSSNKRALRKSTYLFIIKKKFREKQVHRKFLPGGGGVWELGD